MAVGQVDDPVGRDRQVEVLRVAGDLQRRQADERAAVVEQAAAARAARDRRRRLHQDDLAGGVLAQRRHQAGAHRQLEAARRADGVDRRADDDARRRRDAHRRRGQAGRTQLAEVALGVPQVEPGVEADLLVANGDALRARQHVAVRRQRFGADDDGAALPEQQPIAVVGDDAPHARRDQRIDLGRRQRRGATGAAGERSAQAKRAATAGRLTAGSIPASRRRAHRAAARPLRSARWRRPAPMPDGRRARCRSRHRHCGAAPCALRACCRDRSRREARVATAAVSTPATRYVLPATGVNDQRTRQADLSGRTTRKSTVAVRPAAISVAFGGRVELPPPAMRGPVQLAASSKTTTPYRSPAATAPRLSRRAVATPTGATYGSVFTGAGAWRRPAATRPRPRARARAPGAAGRPVSSLTARRRSHGSV